MNKIILLIIPFLLLTGCDDRKCIESHVEQDMCVYTIWNGKTAQPTIIPCTKTVCDEYEELGDK